MRVHARPLPGLVALGALLLSAGSAAGQSGRTDPLTAVRDADPMELARVTHRIGDGAVLAQMDDEARPAHVRLAAVRATPWLEAPEAALPSLSTLGAGRDPDLAPAAVLAATRIARALSAAELTAREAPSESLEDARAAFGAIATDASARADVRAGAGVVAARLGSFLAPRGD